MSDGRLGIAGMTGLQEAVPYYFYRLAVSTDLVDPDSFYRVPHYGYRPGNKECFI